VKKLRLLVTERCARSCSGCCNHDWDLAALPTCESYAGYDEVLLTGGEPMLYPEDPKP
jgi:molybdenum cofactor biosynthesis enzyme MoaA